MRCDSPYSYTPTYVKDNLTFNASKVVSSLSEDNYNSDMGTMVNVSINTNNNLTINNNKLTWQDFAGMKWSDLK